MFNLPKLIGHRGVRNLSPENTTDSVKLAKDLGLNWVEIDVKITKDLIPILLHDDSLERTTNGKGLPVDYNYNELKSLDAGYFFNNQKTPIHIPTLEEILHLSQILNINLNIELKPNVGFEKKNVIAIINSIKNSKFDKKYYFSSFDLNSLIMIKENFLDSECGLLINEFTNEKTLDEVINISKKYNFFCCGFNKEILNLEIIKKIKNNNLIITLFSEENFNTKEANELWSTGVSSLFIDDPSEFNSF